MTLRLIIRTDGARVPGYQETSFQTVDVDLPEVEQLLNAGGFNEDGTFLARNLVGVEVLRADVGTVPDSGGSR